MSRRSLKICAQHSYSVKVGRSEHRGAGGRARSWRRQLEARGDPPFVFPDGTCPTVGGASMARGADGAVQEKTGSESSNCPDSDNEAKQSHENGHDLRRLISILILRKILWLTFMFACLKKRDTRRAPTDWSRGGEG